MIPDAQLLSSERLSGFHHSDTVDAKDDEETITCVSRLEDPWFSISTQTFETAHRSNARQPWSHAIRYHTVSSCSMVQGDTHFA